jgi:hypothetical protein
METVVLDLRADAAPMHVARFSKTARDGGYDGTLFTESSGTASSRAATRCRRIRRPRLAMARAG